MRSVVKPRTRPPGVRARRGRSDLRGSLSLFFCSFIFVLIGAMILSFLVGGRVAQQLQTQNAADASTRAMGAYAAQGLNLMSVNNQGIAGALHVNNALLVLGFYGGVLRAMLYGTEDLARDAVKQTMNGVHDTAIQRDVFRSHQKLGRLFMATAAGLTHYNTVLRDAWLFLAPSKGIEFGLLNSPGAIVFPAQQGDVPGGFDPPFVPMKFERGTTRDDIVLAVASPKEALCLITDVVPAGDDRLRDAFPTWLAGPMESVIAAEGRTAGVGSLFARLAKAFEAVVKVSPLKFGFMKCGVALKSPLFRLFQLKNLMSSDALGSGAAKTLGQGAEAARIGRAVVSRVDDKHNGSHLCGVHKGLYQADLMRSLTINGATDDDFNDRLVRANMLRTLWEDDPRSEEQKNRGPREIRFSQKSWEECPTDSKDPSCHQVLLLHKDTFLCPLKDKILSSQALVNSCARRVGKMAHPKAEITRWLESVCGASNYDAWEENGTAPDNTTGFMLVDWGCQAESYADMISTPGKRSAFDQGRRFNVGTQPDINVLRSDFGICDGKAKLKAPATTPRTGESTLGFMYIRNDPAALGKFESRMRFKSLVATPVLLPSEAQRIWKDNGCSAYKVTEIVQPENSRCRLEMSALFAQHFFKMEGEGDTSRAQRRILSGGVEGLGAEDALWRRMNWAISKSRVLHLPGPGDPRPRPHMRLFWPVWSVGPARASLGEFISESSTTLKPFAALLDTMAGAK